MTETPGMAVIGLGVVGRRMIEQVGLHRGWRIAAAYDADPVVRAAIRQDHPDLKVLDSAAMAIAQDDVRLVYVAVPPLFHHDLVMQAIAARRAVLCEKPLGIDVNQSKQLAQAMNQSGLPQAVNFVFSSAAAVDRLAQGLQAPGFDLRAIEIRLHFQAWPRDWQRGAAWLTRSDQGGFVREVLSHFIFLLMRLLGPVTLRAGQVCGPAAEAAETAAQALLDVAGIPVSISGVVGGSGPDVVEARFTGASQAYVLSDWYHLSHHDALHPQGCPVAGLPEVPRVATYQRQLDQLLALLQARPHSLASFDTALAVQVLIEGLLAQRRIAHFERGHVMSIPTTMNFVDHGKGGDPDVLVPAQCAVPQPVPGEVLVRVAYAGVNRPDCLQRSGRYPPPVGASPIVGLEVSGEVVALGEGVTQWKVGDKLCALTNGGAYAEYVTVPQGQALPIPKGYSMLQAAALPENFFTVWTNVFQRGKLQKGETFLVHGGSSGIGLTAIQLAHAFGAKVFCTVGNEEKAKACREVGADVAINYRSQDFVEEVMAHTQKLGVNMVLDMVGGSYIQRNLQVLSPDGRLVQIAFLQPSKVEVDWVSLMAKRLTFTGSTLRPRTAADKAQMARELNQHVWPLLEAGSVKPVIYKVFDLAQANQAHALMESSEHIGKIMLKVAG